MLDELVRLQVSLQKYGERWRISPGRPELADHEVIDGHDTLRMLELLYSRPVLRQLCAFSLRRLGPVAVYPDAEDVLADWFMKRFQKVVAFHDPLFGYATLTTALPGPNSNLVFTARVGGSRRQLTTVAYVNPGTTGAGLSIAAVPDPLAGTAIRANLASDERNAVVTTAAQIRREMADSMQADELVGVDLIARNGKGVAAAMAAAPLEVPPQTTPGWVLFRALLLTDLARFCEVRRRRMVRAAERLPVVPIPAPGAAGAPGRQIPDTTPSPEQARTEHERAQQHQARKEQRRAAVRRCLDTLAPKYRWYIVEHHFKGRKLQGLEDECKDAARWLVDQHLDGGVPSDHAPTPLRDAARWLMVEAANKEPVGDEDGRLRTRCLREQKISPTTTRQRVHQARNRLIECLGL